MESLEARVLLTTCDVTTNADDSSPNSLRGCIAMLNQNPGSNDRITFHIQGSSTVIQLNSALPAIIDPMVIDGTTQSGFNNGVPVVIIDGSFSGASAGLDVLGGNTTIVGLNLQGFNSGAGIQLEGAGGDTVMDNFLGPDAGGTITAGNLIGLEISSGSGDTIGGVLPHEGNLLSGNFFYGLFVATGNNVIEGNFIGTDLNATMALANGFEGASITAPLNTIGGTSPGAGNVISANGGPGLDISSDSNVVQGNFIGTDPTGTVALGNSSDGLTISGNNNTIGGTDLGARNIISGNTNNGMSIFAGSGNLLEGNYIGLDKNGAIAIPNAIGVSLFSAANTRIGGTVAGTRNLISGNAGAGVAIAFSTGSLLQGNFIGTDGTGTVALSNIASGVVVSSASSGNTIGGTVLGSTNLISGNQGSGILITGPGTTGTLVQGNYIGTDLTGTMALGNQLDGVTITDEAFNNTIGGTINGPNTGARNLISGNLGSGVNINHEASTTGNRVISNYIGTDVTGGTSLGNGFGVTIADGASGNTIGGYPDQPNGGDRYGNLLSGNVNYGVGIAGPGTAANVVLGNLIGTDFTGRLAVPNSDGVDLFDGAGGTVAASANIIGGYVSTVNGQDHQATNVISGNTNDGVHIYDSHTTGNLVQQNLIGTDVTGSVALANNYGVEISGGATGDTIGGYPDQSQFQHPATNWIAGNTLDGVHIIDSRTSGNMFLANDIGLSINRANGQLLMLPNGGYGVSISYQATGNIIGGGNVLINNTMFSGGNIIAANALDGIGIFREATSNVILGNQIGSISARDPMDPFARVPFPNGGAGVHIFDTGSVGNTIGGVGAGEGNIITDNMSDGILVDSSTGNSIRANSIYENSAGNKGIHLVNNGNNNQPAPDLTQISAMWDSVNQQITISGTFSGAPDTTYYLDFFASPNPPDPSDLAGRQYLGTITVLIDAAGDPFTIMPTMLSNIMPDITGQFLTATATTTIVLPNGNLKETDTSEFSGSSAISGAASGPVRVNPGQPVTAIGVAATGMGSVNLSPEAVQPGPAAATTGQGLSTDPQSLDSVFARYEHLSQLRGSVEELLASLAPNGSGGP